MASCYDHNKLRLAAVDSFNVDMSIQYIVIDINNYSQRVYTW